MTRKYLWETLLIVLISINLEAKPVIVSWRVLSDKTFDASKIYCTDLYINKDKTIFVEIANFLWINNNWINTNKYGFYMNGYITDDQLYLIFKSTDKQHIDIYDIGKEFILEKQVNIEGASVGEAYWPGLPRVIYVPGDSNSLYLLSAQNHLSTNPLKAIHFWLTGGHGILYDKPILANIQGQKLLKFYEIAYGGKTNESYRVEKVLTGKDTIYLLGFQTQEQMGSGFGDRPPTPVVLHYAEYNTKKKKLIQAQDIYENTPHHEAGANNEHINYYYGKVSADNIDDEDVAVVFSWIKDHFTYKGNAVIENEIIQSQIYYAQCGKEKFNGIEKIGDGFIPLVRTDSLGNVHVIWINNEGSIIHKEKKDGKWSNEEVVLNGVDNTPSKMFGNYICAEFDKDNILNIVFPSNGNIVHAKVKFD